MNEYAATALINLGIIAAVGVTVYITGSAWAILGLLFLCGVSHKEHNHICPHCGKEWKV